jgi:signal transduction histidine kinase
VRAGPFPGAQTTQKTRGSPGRNSGIPAVGLSPWGSHFCQFYRTQQDLLDILVPYFCAGLAGNERCVWVTGPLLEADVAEAAMRAAVPDFDRAVRDRQLEIVPYDEWYVQEGHFDKQRVLDGWKHKLLAGQARGYEGLRVSGNTAWLEEATWRDFADYEATINEFIADYPIIALCTYWLDTCSTDEIIDVLRHHQFALIKRGGQWDLIEPSERKQATAAVETMNRALEQRTAELQAALAELQTFSYSVSHDLKAPLRAIGSYAQALAEDYRGRLDEAGQRMLTRIEANAARMERLISDTLAYAMAQRAELGSVPVDMNTLTRAAYQQVAGGEPGRQVDLRIHPLPRAAGDAGMVQEVMANLLSNALKYTRREPVARIEVGTVDADGAGPAYYVRDNGIGFDMADAGHLFRPFQRLHSLSEFEGTGLGLAIVRQIVTRHGGRVWAEGTPGGGAMFCFTLPPATAPAVPADA